MISRYISGKKTILKIKSLHTKIGTSSLRKRKKAKGDDGIRIRMMLR